MYLNPTDKHWVIDIETDSLDAKIIWVMCAKNVKTKEEKTLTNYAEIRNFIQGELARGCIFVGHNILAFDAPVLNRLAATRITSVRLVDTFLLSMLYSPSLRGGHNLDAWGERVGERKIFFKDFSHLSDEMIKYCLQDVRVTCKVYERLTARMRQIGFSEDCVKIEHLAWRNIQKQRKNGFKFDQPRAHTLFAELRGLEEEIKGQIYHAFPPILTELRTYAKAFKRDGQPTVDYERHLEQYPKIKLNDEGTYTVFDWVEFNLGSPKQRVEKLLELGWEPYPDEYTKITEKGGGGNPTPTYKGELVPSLVKFVEEHNVPEVKLIAEWMAFNGRANMIGNWLDLYNEETGCIHGNLWLANTLRYRHSDPNTANIPAVRVDKVTGLPLLARLGFYTYESRDLWVTRDPATRNLVGVDAKGIQLRVLAHHLNNPEYTAQVLGGDPHNYTMSITQTGTRANNKNFIYAYLLGGGNAKLGALLGVDAKAGGRIKNKFTNNFPGLKELLARIQGDVKRTGRLRLCDGAMAFVPEPRLALAYLLQGDESRIMRQAGIYVDEEIRRKGLDVLKVGDIHDEWQSDVSIGDTEEYLRVCRESFKRAGETFRYNLPIECDGKVGKTWAETH